MPVHQNASFHEHVRAIQPRFRTTRPLKHSCRGIGRLHRGKIMKQIIWAMLATSTLLTPVVAQAATVEPVPRQTFRAFSDDALFQPGDEMRGERPRGEGRRGGRTRDRADIDRGPDNEGPAPQEQQVPRSGRTWSQERSRDDDREGYRNNEGGRERSDDRRGGGERNWGVHRSWGSDNDDRRHRWNEGWRNDRRYDWRGHRNRHHDYYNPGRYYSPYRGHGYRRFGIGISIGSGYYGSRYWISDPSYYRLPPVYGPYRWVRYYDDVLLIDLRNGRVVDAIHDFFW
ncbi:hypothetical protein EUU23_08870 [Sphingorhabdus sp. IMCC26285]|jgi:hypothetical protein|uniref:Uncharacterized protein n=2 Tax=Sphingorhabdus profundilacus TaxID=2509718 RepID=A0A6I4M597_9SPHN|nr:hypothetical protein [Sphingorhabdus profundilacus]